MITLELLPSIRSMLEAAWRFWAVSCTCPVVTTTRLSCQTWWRRTTPAVVPGRWPDASLSRPSGTAASAYSASSCHWCPAPLNPPICPSPTPFTSTGISVTKRSTTSTTTWTRRTSTQHTESRFLVHWQFTSLPERRDRVWLSFFMLHDNQHAGTKYYYFIFYLLWFVVKSWMCSWKQLPVAAGILQKAPALYFLSHSSTCCQRSTKFTEWSRCGGEFCDSNPPKTNHKN